MRRKKGEFTMSCVRIVLASVLTLMLSAMSVRAAGDAEQANLDILRDTIRANKKALVAASLTLSDQEAAQFWPLYDKYQAELTAVNDRAVKVIQDYTSDYKNLSNEKA